MAKKYRVMVFGKTGCEKCKVLQARLDQMLAEPAWADFEKAYCDVEQEEGLVQFCKAECVNPSRIPAFVVARHDEALRRYVLIPNAQPAPEEDAVCKRSRLYAYLGLQTDYSDSGRGVISPKMIAAILDEARRTE